MKKKLKLEFITTKNFSTVKGYVKWMKMQATAKQNIFPNYVSNKRFIPRKDRELSKLNNKKQFSLKKWAKEQTLYQRGNMDGKHSYEKMVNIINY